MTLTGVITDSLPVCVFTINVFTINVLKHISISSSCLCLSVRNRCVGICPCNMCTMCINYKTNFKKFRNNALKLKQTNIIILCGLGRGPFLSHVKYATTW